MYAEDIWKRFHMSGKKDVMEVIVRHGSSVRYLGNSS